MKISIIFPVIEEGKIIGVISATDLLFNQANNPLYLRQVLEKLTEPIGAARYSEVIGSAVRSLFHSGLGAAQIGQIISSLNDALVKRLAELAQLDSARRPGNMLGSYSAPKGGSSKRC